MKNKIKPVTKKREVASISGNRFGILTVVNYEGKNDHGDHTWSCLCDCGRITTVIQSRLLSSHTKSCGCLRYKHSDCYPDFPNELHTMWNTPEYKAYYEAKRRCEQPSIRNYHRYGGRGIKFLFKSFDEFFLCIGSRPDSSHSLDRIDNNGHYEQGNVSWTPHKKNARNRGNNTLLDFQGEKKCLAEWSEVTGIDRRTIRSRLSMGWSVEKALSKPTGKYEKR